MTRVSFVPTQTPDEFALTSSRVAAHSPIRLFMQDIWVLLRNLRYVPNTVLPWTPNPKLPGVVYSKWRDTIDNVLIIITTLLEVVLLGVGVVAVVVLPGWAIFLYAALSYALVMVFVVWMWGSLVVHSSVELPASSQRFDGERWFFLNGICTRYGIIGDILECLIQRCLGYNTKDVRTAYEWISLAVVDTEVTKVVIVAHSQGGIVCSLILDRIYAELPEKAISKIEVYTFGSAAAHFNNPLTDVAPAMVGPSPISTRSPETSLTNSLTNGELPAPPPPRAKHYIHTVEHYCNELDLVPRWGVLYNTQKDVKQRYAGRVFIHKGASGHLFNPHYLATMFPLDAQKFEHFLDQVVDVDTQTALKRAQSADDLTSEQGVERGRRRWYGTVTDSGLSKRPSWKIRVGDETEMALEEGSGRTVRQLSRLAKYVGGGIG